MRLLILEDVIYDKLIQIDDNELTNMYPYIVLLVVSVNDNPG